MLSKFSVNGQQDRALDSTNQIETSWNGVAGLSINIGNVLKYCFKWYYMSIYFHPLPFKCCFFLHHGLHVSIILSHKQWEENIPQQLQDEYSMGLFSRLYCELWAVRNNIKLLYSLSMCIFEQLICETRQKIISRIYILV